MPRWTKEQNEAINLDNSNIIVSAGAGSGKTAVLSQRVLRKLKDGVNIDELLILTFTKAAAEEMKIRIRKKIAEEPTLQEQLSRIDNAYITTFDSYCLTIVKKYNYLLNVSSNISIIDSNIIKMKKEDIIDEIFNYFYTIKDSKFLKLIDDFCQKDDKSIKKSILDINAKLDMRYDKEEYLNNYLNYFYNDEYILEKIREYENILLNKIAIINQQFETLEEYVDSDYYMQAYNALAELLISDNYDQVKQNLNVLPRLPKNATEEAKKTKDNISSLLKELSILCCYKDKEEIKDSIYKTKEYVEIIITIIKELDKRINNYKFKTDLYEFNDIAKMAISVLEKNKEIALELKASLNEIMIDEYQDTNDLQDKFISLIEDNNVYMVGDIKQSIYRFRNANPLLFKSKYDEYSQNSTGIKIDLNKNFRSRREVLDNINLIFNCIMDDFIGGANYKETHQMIFGNLAYENEGKMNHSNDLEILNYSYDKQIGYSKEEIEAFCIAHDIKEKIEKQYLVFDKDSLQKRPIKYEDIVILMDRATNFNLYKKIFEYLNIPLAVYKDESISNSMDISIIKNILNLMLNNYSNQDFKYSFVSVLRSYLFSTTDNEIFNYFIQENYEKSKLMEIINSIDYHMLTPKEIIEQIIDKFDMYNKIITVGDVDKHLTILDYLITLASNLTDIGYTIYDFYNYLCRLQEMNYDITLPSFNSSDGVKIMTIHKSKGLEYHICYYSGLYAKFNLSDIKERFMYDNNYGLITPFIDQGIRSTIYKDLIKNKQIQEEISEKIRLFYVALTRAKEKIILIASLNEESNLIGKIVDNNIRLKYSSFLDILNSIKPKLIKYIHYINLENINLTHDYNLIKKSNYKKIIKENAEKLKIKALKIISQEIEDKHFSKVSNKLITKEEHDNMEFGNHFHEIMQNIDFLNPQYDLLNKMEAQKVKAFIDSKILDGVKNIYKEYEFEFNSDNVIYHGFIDLLLEYDSEYKIVDYKLKNTQDSAYIKQLAGYKNYIQTLTKKDVSVYLYSILNESLEKISL